MHAYTYRSSHNMHCYCDNITGCSSPKLPPQSCHPVTGSVNDSVCDITGRSSPKLPPQSYTPVTSSVNDSGCDNITGRSSPKLPPQSYTPVTSSVNDSGCAFGQVWSLRETWCNLLPSIAANHLPGILAHSAIMHVCGVSVKFTTYSIIKINCAQCT